MKECVLSVAFCCMHLLMQMGDVVAVQVLLRLLYFLTLVSFDIILWHMN